MSSFASTLIPWVASKNCCHRTIRQRWRHNPNTIYLPWVLGNMALPWWAAIKHYWMLNKMVLVGCLHCQRSIWSNILFRLRCRLVMMKRLTKSSDGYFGGPIWYWSGAYHIFRASIHATSRAQPQHIFSDDKVLHHLSTDVRALTLIWFGWKLNFFASDSILSRFLKASTQTFVLKAAVIRRRVVVLLIFTLWRGINLALFSFLKMRYTINRIIHSWKNILLHDKCTL